MRFGLFEADLQASELRKRGLRIRLQEQPFQVLALLLENPGTIVSREELRTRLWPADTFVDFDHSLNTAINKIREALGDDAPNPRFVETIARRGYRFIAPVQTDGNRFDQAQSPMAGASSPEPTAPRADTVPAPADFHEELGVPLPHRFVTRGLFALIQVMYLTFYVVALFRWEGAERVAASFLPAWGAGAVVACLWLSSLMGIPLRLYLFSAAAFDYRRLGMSFRRLFPVILPLDALWATCPFLISHQIGVGAAFAAMAALLYLPFSERVLVRMAYPLSDQKRA